MTRGNEEERRSRVSGDLEEMRGKVRRTGWRLSLEGEEMRPRWSLESKNSGKEMVKKKAKIQVKIKLMK